MNIDELKIVLENHNIPPDVIDEITGSVGDLGEKIAPLDENTVEGAILKLQEAMAKEPDWRKKAAMAARLISMNLSHY
jgi:hypothetical protein